MNERGQIHQENPGEDILVILTPGFPADEADSTCLTSQQLLVLALNRNYPDTRIVILTMEYPYRRAPYTWNGNRVIPFDTYNKGKLYKLQAWRKVWRTLRHLQKLHHLTGIFSFWCTECALIGKCYGKRYGIAHYIWILGQDARKDNRFIKFIRPKPGELVALSDFLVKEFERNHGVRPDHIIRNAIDSSLFDTSPIARDIDVLGVGSLIPLKQYDVFISVIASLVPHVPGIKAVVCGKGPEMDRLKERIDKLGLAGHISLTGEKPHVEVLQLMRRSRILLHPSSYEGYCTACLEALYAGAHVCSFCNPGSGLIRQWHIADSQKEMTEQVLSILQDPGREHDQILLNSMDDCAKAVMSLFRKNSSRESNIRFYDAIAAEYDAILDKEESNRGIRQAVATRFMKTVPAGCVLDFGGGTGLDLKWLTKNRYNVIFCEPSRGMRDQAIMRNMDLLGSKQVIFLEDVRTDFSTWGKMMPFEQKVDAILSNFAVINSIQDIGLLFRNLALVVKPYGHFFALVLNERPHLFSSGLTGAVKSLIGGRLPEMKVNYRQCEQSVYLHPKKSIRKVSRPWFELYTCEPFGGMGFSLIHLIRKTDEAHEFAANSDFTH
ncbi:glycosyltransferase [Puia dinghuensis]|uniref:Glycosyl transferase family 1 domain-containing protein n=1 Tax=Puia dinghuensis TaxID=1792502 RepID=A0A8J2UHS8_9BACT|nr:glycosyltransferase [Puia dinghuensis]GGB18844.1 hypothetical protein GCM10011511_48300 [Puia dinghuensis]